MIGALALLLLAAAPGAVAQVPAVAHRVVRTSDGAALALYRYGAQPTPGGTRPVLLLPELGFDRRLYDLHGRGLARWLARRGRTVYLAELRGQGNAGPRAGSRLQDWVTVDLPAIARALDDDGAPRFDLVAHGFAGSLALASTTRELAGRVQRVVALATPVRAEVPNALTAAVLRAGGRWSRLSLDPAAARGFDLLFAQGARIPRDDLAELRRSARDLGARRALSLLRWMESGDLAFDDGSSLTTRLASYDRPTLLFLALRNNFAHAEFAAPLRDLPGGRVAVRMLARVDLLREDYSHLSLLQGEGAPFDVFAPALAFLDAG